MPSQSETARPYTDDERAQNRQWLVDIEHSPEIVRRILTTQAEIVRRYEATVAHLEAEVARLAADRERIDWLEAQVYESHPDEPERIDSIGSVTISGAWPGKGIARVYVEVGEEGPETSGDSLREAIDAAYHASRSTTEKNDNG